VQNFNHEQNKSQTTSMVKKLSFCCHKHSHSLCSSCTGTFQPIPSMKSPSVFTCCFRVCLFSIVSQIFHMTLSSLYPGLWLNVIFFRNTVLTGIPKCTPPHWILEKAMAPHSSTLAWKIPWMEEPGRLQSMGLLRVGHDWATSLSLFTFMHWRRKWQPTPVFLPGESQGRGSLVGCRLWGRIESDTTEAT